MRKLVLLAAAALAAAAALGGTASRAAPLTFGTRFDPAPTPEISSNWSGYSATSGDGTVTFSDVTGTWVQPRVRCTDGRIDAVAFWVGLGGYSQSANALEQLGTAAECHGVGRTPTYYAWWEIVPAPSVPIPLVLRPGDRVNAAVLVNGQTVTMSLKNLTRHTRFSKTIRTPQVLDVSSAEWIAEAPANCSTAGHCRVIPLTNFGTVSFTNAALIGDGHPGTISDPTWTASPIKLIGNGTKDPFFGTGDPLGTGVGAVPGLLSSDGRSFDVAWQRTVSP